MKVSIIRNYEYPDLFRQTPNGMGEWDGVQFHLGPIDECDYLVVLNKPNEDVKIKCRAGCKWLIVQEPPYEQNNYLTNYYKYFDKVFTQVNDPKFPNIINSHTALPWHVDKNYDELSALSENDLNLKNDKISWITSTKSFHPGHVERMKFLDYVKNSGLSIDLFGKGINPIENKFDGLFPYKYSIAVESYSGSFYWTEKIADAFLSWTMPLYFGCTNITDYFPAGSMIRVDITKPKEALEIIRNAVEGQLWEKNIDKIREARNLVLNKYQMFPFLHNLIKKDIEAGISSTATLKSYSIPASGLSKLAMMKRSLRSRLKKFI